MILLKLKINLTLIFFNFRNDPYVGCEKINDKFCICFIPNVDEGEVKILKQAIEIYKKGPKCQDAIINKLTVFRPRDFFILSEFFTRYGSTVRENE